MKFPLKHTCGNKFTPIACQPKKTENHQILNQIKKLLAKSPMIANFAKDLATFLSHITNTISNIVNFVGGGGISDPENDHRQNAFTRHNEFLVTNNSTYVFLVAQMIIF
jgi:hypothetical protein